MRTNVWMNAAKNGALSGAFGLIGGALRDYDPLLGFWFVLISLAVVIGLWGPLDS